MMSSTFHVPVKHGKSDTLENSEKRPRIGEPENYHVMHQEATGATVQVLDLDFAANMSQLSEWNDQLSTLVISLQERIGALSVLPESALHQPTSHPKSTEDVHTLNSTLSSAAYKSQEPDVLSSPHQPVKRQSSAPVLQRLDSRTDKTAGHRSTACESDARHGVRRVYTMGLRKPRAQSMRSFLETHGVDTISVLYSQPIAYTIDEFIVDIGYVVPFLKIIYKIQDVRVLKFFDPLNPKHPALTEDQQESFPIMYRRFVKERYNSAHGTARRGFKEYAQDYMKGIGI